MENSDIHRAISRYCFPKTLIANHRATFFISTMYRCRQVTLGVSGCVFKSKNPPEDPLEDREVCILTENINLKGCPTTEKAFCFNRLLLYPLYL